MILKFKGDKMEPQYSDILGTMVYCNYVLPYVESMRNQPREKREPYKQKRKCLREVCQNMTTHNGGYCSAECCKEDRK
jgi:hypothetical protein